ncbi:TPA: restriction endonuclease subunit S [Acinetobacter baumannii]
MKSVRFGDLCKLQNGRAFKPEEWSEEGTPIVRIQNLNDETKPFNYCNFDVEKRFWIDSGDLLFSWSGTPGTSFGAFFWNRGKGFLNQHIFRVDVKEELVDKHYLRYALNSLIVQIIDQAHGGVGLKHITKGKLEEVQIPLPPLPEQRRIVSILDKADELRQKRQQAIEKLDRLLQATFIDMFGDPVSNSKGWDSSTLGEQCEVGTGSTPSRQNAEYFVGNIPWVKSTEVDWGTITDTSEKISKDGKNSARLKMYPKGSIILALYGQGITRGKSALLGIEATLNQACAALITKGSVNNYFVFSFLRFSYENLRNQARGGNQENLNLNIVKSFPIYLPPIELQEKWSKIALSIEDQKQKLYKQLDIQNQLFSSLQNQAFSGTL